MITCETQKHEKPSLNKTDTLEKKHMERLNQGKMHGTTEVLIPAVPGVKSIGCPGKLPSRNKGLHDLWTSYNPNYSMILQLEDSTCSNTAKACKNEIRELPTGMCNLPLKNICMFKQGGG